MPRFGCPFELIVSTHAHLSRDIGRHSRSGHAVARARPQCKDIGRGERGADHGRSGAAAGGPARGQAGAAKTEETKSEEHQPEPPPAAQRKPEPPKGDPSKTEPPKPGRQAEQKPTPKNEPKKEVKSEPRRCRRTTPRSAPPPRRGSPGCSICRRKLRSASPAPPSEEKANLTSEQIAAFKAQVSKCWVAPAGTPSTPDVTVFMRIALSPDGTLGAAPELIAAPAEVDGRPLPWTARSGRCRNASPTRPADRQVQGLENSRAGLHGRRPRSRCRTPPASNFGVVAFPDGSAVYHFHRKCI